MELFSGLRAVLVPSPSREQAVDQTVNPDSNSDAVPDLRWCNRNLLIADVAKHLGLQMEGDRMIHCWHPERHKNGDRTASVGIWRSTNKVKCFACATPPIGVIDLVMDVLAIDIPSAAAWLSEHFDVQKLPKGIHIGLRPDEHPYRVGYEQPIDLLVKSGIWAALSPQSQRVIPVLLAFAEKRDTETFAVSLSYRAFLRHAGVKSFSSISKAIAQLEEIGWLSIQQRRNPNGIRGANLYILTPYCETVRELANAMSAQRRGEINAEREIRAKQKKARAEALNAATRCVALKEERPLIT